MDWEEIWTSLWLPYWQDTSCYKPHSLCMRQAVTSAAEWWVFTHESAPSGRDMIVPQYCFIPPRGGGLRREDTSSTVTMRAGCHQLKLAYYLHIYRYTQDMNTEWCFTCCSLRISNCQPRQLKHNGTQIIVCFIVVPALKGLYSLPNWLNIFHYQKDGTHCKYCKTLHV